MPKQKKEPELTPKKATDFLKQYEKDQSELCWKEIQESLKKYNRAIAVLLSMNENEEIRKQIILTKAV